ncbi:hypothetical protein BDN71DRAFT_1453442 [Pleurotus eryngii]|uniref:Uncharacterized protein n=1 Tax=Pleurotus eryngii TaxID=5323 RepID=A0A9P5ZP62_PLEER|nr:hypothetical protein BDN71DRAFT_1453442 [Pleurotus eryngii]
MYPSSVGRNCCLVCCLLWQHLRETLPLSHVHAPDKIPEPPCDWAIVCLPPLRAYLELWMRAFSLVKIHSQTLGR